MNLVDLHEVVPDPPDDLLSLSGLTAAVRRRRIARQITATAGTAAVVAAAVLLGVAVGGSTKAAPRKPLLIQPVNHRDGRIVFAQKDAGSPSYLPLTSLYSTDANARGVERITRQPGGIDQVVGSPDGKRIAYTEETYGQKPRERYVNGEYVHIVNADGTDDRRIYSCPSSACEDLVWSPDSQRLLINGDRVLEPDGQIEPLCVGHCTPTSSTEEATWSPDSKKLAFQYWVNVPLHNGRPGPAGTSTVSAIGVMNADGSHPQLITDQECSAAQVNRCSSDTNPMWSPDGTTIAFNRQAPTYLIPNNSLGGPASFGPNRIDLVHPDGSQARQLVNCGVYCGIRSMSWSPTAQKLAFVTYDGRGLNGRPPWALHIVDPRSGAMLAEQLTFLTDETSPDYAWAPSGTRIALGMRASNGTWPTGIYLVSVTAKRLGPPRPLTSKGLPPIAWLPRD